MHKRAFISLTVLMLLASGAASAQPATGTPPFGTFSGGPVDVVNNANLNVHVQIPILNKAGRGLPFTYALSYDNSIWTKVMNNGVTSWAPASSGWAGSTNAVTVDTGYVTFQTTQSQCGPNPTYYFYQYTNFSYHDSSGASHVLNPVSTTLAYVVNCLPGNYPPTSASTTTNDGTGYTVTLQAAYNSAWASSVVNLSGLLISQNPGAGSGTNTDRNGNQLSWSTASGTVTFTDTLNTPVLTVPSSGLLTYKDPQNGNSSYTPTWGTRGVQTAFGCPGVSEYSGMMTLLSSLTLPDGTSYSFTYETPTGYPQYVTGRIASVTLPTGGTISYQYSGGNNGINCSDGTTPTLTRTTPDGAWTYSRSGNTTTITTPASDHTTILSQGIYEVQRNVYKGAVSPSNLLVTLDTCYNGSSSPCTGTAVSTPITQVNVITTLPGSTALKSKRLTTFDSLGNALPQEVDEYDYGPGAVGSLVRKTLISYASLGNNITDMPSSVTVQDGNSATQAQTTYAYDEYGLQTTSAPQHVSITGSRGNLTTITRYVTGSATLTQHFHYFDTGNIYTAADVNGTVTTYAYATGTSCGNSFVTSTTVTGTGLPSNPALSTSSTWDANCYGAVQLTATDPNNQTTTTRYNENSNIIWRPTSVSDPTGATTAIGYTPHSGTTPASVESALNFATSSTVDNFTSLDGFGRVHISQRKQSQTATNYDSIQTDYDSLGRPRRVTIPYSDVKNATRSSGNAATTTYDALGRPYVVTDSGGGWTQYTYDRNDVLVEVGPQVTQPSSENTKKRQLEYDALGRLTSVCELTSGSGSGTCSQTASQTGYWTKYTYNQLDKLTGVTQNAQVSSPRQTRAYVYDWLGRMTSETNPESGTFSYTYDSDATCGTYSGDMVKRADAKSTPNVTCYQYDGLHRVTASLPHTGSPDYSITPQKHYVYDQSAGLGSLGRLGHAYTCPASTPDCSGSSTWITDLGFVYTSRGELSDVWEFTPHSNGAYYHVNATYWANGLINSLNSGLTGLPTWTYNPEGEGRVTTVIASSGQNPVPTGTPVSYNTWGLPNGVSFGSGDSNTFVYDDSASGRLTQYQASVNGSLMTGVLTWNANGSLRQLAITDALNANNAQTCTHQHDDLARIAAVNCGTGKWNQAFTYGSNGFGNVNWTGTGLGTSFTQAYDTTYNTNHFQGTGISYDANGNLLTDVVHTYSWDADGKLHQMDSTIMTYDALGRRVEEANGLAYNQILYGPGGSKLATINGLTQCASSFYLPLPGGAAAFYDCTGLKRYRHADWLGSSRLSSTASRTLNYDGAYSPMGESYSETGTTDRNFTGQNQELANDLYAFQYREYQPIHGRWISPDPAGLGAVNPANPQSLNRYAYVNGSPLNSLDPLGLMCIAYSAGPQTCGWQQAAGWLVGQGGWNPGSGMGVPPHGGLSNASSEVITSAAAADEGRYVAYVRAAYIASVFQEYPILQSIYLGFGNIGVITSTTITFAGEVDDWKQQMALLSAEGLIASVNKAADAAEHNSNTGVGTGPTRAKQGDLTPDRLAMITGSVENMPNIGAPVHYPPAVCAALPWVGGGLSAASAAAGLVYWPVGAGIMVVGGAGCY